LPPHRSLLASLSRRHLTSPIDATSLHKIVPLPRDALPLPPTQSGDALNQADGELRMRRAASMASGAGTRSGRETSLVVGRQAGGVRARGPSMAAWVTSERGDSMADGASSARGRFHGKRAGASNLHGRWWGRGELQARGRASSEHGSFLRGRHRPAARPRYSPFPTAASDACECWPPVRLREQDKVDTKNKER
jgi:hypothetical protein